MQVKMEHEEEERQRVDWADMDVDESVDGMMTCVDLGGSVGIDNPQEEQREEQWLQDKQEEQLAEARTREGEWGLARRRKDRERQGGTQRTAVEWWSWTRRRRERRKD